MVNTKAYKVIVGLGKTGLSCARYLAGKGQPFIVMDSRHEPPSLAEFRQEFPTIPCHLGGFDADILAQAAEIILSPGVALDEPAIQREIEKGKAVVGDIELFAREAKAPIVAITGSNGKSTVVSLLGQMVRQAGKQVQVAGNIGLPVLEALQQVPDWYVLELSSFQLETTYSLQAFAASILNISEDHMDRYADLAAYTTAKQRIYRASKHLVYNRHDSHTFPGNAGSAKLLSFGLDKPSVEQFGLLQEGSHTWLAKGDEKWLRCSELRIIGKHNWANALAALALGYCMDLPREAMLQTLREFPGLPHRCEWLTERQAVAWYNDSKATNVGAALAAIEGLGQTIEGKLVLIAGGVGKEADFSPLTAALGQYVKAVILIGQDAAQIAKVIPPHVLHFNASSLEQAVSIAEQQAKSQDAVLLAPACASFDMFSNFEHRGAVFKSLVRSLT
jgi:UDP-N-acetylmuramoylalanine--D-glutamate ligase